MTTLKIQGKPGSAAQSALAPHIRGLYSNPGKRVLGIIEMAHIERTQPGPDSDKDASVTMRITQMEIPNDEQEGLIREAQRALFIQRTAIGTLDGEGQVELSQDTLRLTGGMLHAIETARLRAALSHWAEYARRCVANSKLTLTEMAHELDTIATGMTTALNTATDEDDDDVKPSRNQTAQLALDDQEGAAAPADTADADRELLAEAAHMIITTGHATTTMIQRKMRVGVAKAKELMVILEMRGVVGPFVDKGSRDVLLKPEQADEEAALIRAGKIRSVEPPAAEAEVEAPDEGDTTP